MNRTRIAALLWASVFSFACSFDGSGLGPLDSGITLDPDAAPGTPDASPGAPDARPPADARPDAPPVDGDNDGILDSSDNCPGDSNADQHDEDLDGVGDACDNCPTVANPDQEDDGEIVAEANADGVGDACDPRPDDPGDSILFFDSFKGPLDSDWTVGDGPDDWVIDNDGLVVTATGGGAHLIYWNGQSADRTLVEATGTVLTLAANSTYGVGVASGFLPTGTVGSGYLCYQFTVDDNGGAPPPPANDLMVVRLDGDALPPLDATSTTDALAASVPYRYRFFSDASATPAVQQCGLRVESGSPQTYSADAIDGTYTGGYPGFRTFGVTARFEHIVVYQVGTELSDP